MLSEVGKRLEDLSKTVFKLWRGFQEGRLTSCELQKEIGFTRDEIQLLLGRYHLEEGFRTLAHRF